MRPTRVFLIADNAVEARRLGEIFSNSHDFRVLGISTAQNINTLNPDQIDVLVIRCKASVTVPGGIPVLWLGSARAFTSEPGTTHAFLEHATPDQIRAATQALAAGLRFGPAQAD